MAEKSLNALSRDLRALYNKGCDAMVRDNYDYAVDLFMQVLAREPGVYECRRALRNAQLKKSEAGSKGIFKKFLSSAGSQPQLAKAQVALRKDPLEAMQIAEQVLSNDANSGGAHRIIVEAARALEMPYTAMLSLEVLWINNPKDKDTAIQFGAALSAIGEAQRAETILGELMRLNPGDNDIAQALKNFSARKTLDEGGYEALSNGEGSYRDILRNKDEAVALEQENRQVKDEDTIGRLIREYETRLQAEPKNIKVLRDLAELHSQKKHFDQSLAYYQRLKETDVGNDAGLDRAITETTVRKYEHQLAQLDPNHPDYPEEVARIEAEKHAYSLGEAQRAVERFPTDLQLRFELGQQYFAAGKIGEAISEFQKAQANPHRRVASMNWLAQCFARRKMNDLAARTLQNAIREKTVFDDEKKELIYNLGVVLEAMGKRDEAVEQFKLIYEVDIGYKDVAAKVDAYYSGQS